MTLTNACITICALHFLQVGLNYQNIWKAQMAFHMRIYCCWRVLNIQAIIYDGMMMELLIARLDIAGLYYMNAVTHILQPPQMKIPSDDNFYWKFVVASNAKLSTDMFPIVLQTDSDVTLEFVDRTPQLVSSTTNRSFSML